MQPCNALADAYCLGDRDLTYIVYFSAGARHLDYQREVNDLTFDVALTVVFESTEAQDAYQVTEPHMQFIEEFNENWASVRVFDSLAPTDQ